MSKLEIINKVLLEDLYNNIDSTIQTFLERHPDTDLKKESSRRNIAKDIINNINNIDISKSRNIKVLKCLEERLALGQLKYGQDIPINDGRDWLQEGIEEVLDNMVYLGNYLLALKSKRDGEEEDGSI